MWPHLIRGVHDLNKLKSKYYVKMLEHLFRISGKKSLRKLRRRVFKKLRITTNFQQTFNFSLEENISTLYKKINFPLPNTTSCQVWFKLVKLA